MVNKTIYDTEREDTVITYFYSQFGLLKILQNKEGAYMWNDFQYHWSGGIKRQQQTMAGNLTNEETFAYVEGRIVAVSGTTNSFTKRDLNLVHQASGGVMRMINTIDSEVLTKSFFIKTYAGRNQI